jgi:pyruvate dehydrogenase E1 component
VERHNRLHPGTEPRKSYLEQLLCAAPTVAATDYVRAYGELIAAHVPGRYVVLGTDGFGRSDTRAALRAFFEIDRHHVAVAALAELVRIGRLPLEKLQSALTRYQLDVDKRAPWTL